jgi:hypothetical protein
MHKGIQVFEINATHIPLDVVFCTDVKISTFNHKGHVWQISSLVAVKLKGKKT